MKKLILSLLVMTAVFCVSAQDRTKMKVDKKDVPETVRTAFESQFSDASGVDWYLKEGNYKAKFNINGTKHMAELNAAGEVMSKGMKVDKDQLPITVADGVRTSYASNKIDEVFQIEKEGQTQYLVDLDGKPDKKVLFDAQGKVINEKMDD